MKKELIIFSTIFVVLSSLAHFEQFLDYPLQHIMMLPDANAYGLGYIHPIIFTFIIHIFVLILRVIANKIYKSLKKN